MPRNTSRWSVIRERCLPTGTKLYAIDVINRHVMLEIAGRNRARITGRRVEGRVRVIMVGILKVARGKVLRQVEVNVAGKLRGTRQGHVSTRRRVLTILACSVFIARSLDTGN
jgi:hypothetical protein